MEKPDYLAEWNRIENQETIHKLVAEGYRGILANGPDREAFVTWLLAGTAATAGLVVANIQPITESIGRSGVRWLLFSLIGSLTCGLIAKAATALIPSNAARIREQSERSAAIVAAHLEERMKIKESAEQAERTAPPDLDVHDFIAEFVRPMPFTSRVIVRLMLGRAVKTGERHGDLLIALRAWRLQTQFCSCQVLAVLTALISVAWHLQPT